MKWEKDLETNFKQEVCCSLIQYMYTEDKIKRVNKIIKDMVFNYHGEILHGTDTKFQFDYQFQIKGVRPMISVGEWYDYLTVDVTIIDGSKNFITLVKLFSPIINDYHLKNKLSVDISEELQYFFGSEIVRITLDKDKSSIRFSDELQEKIELTDL